MKRLICLLAMLIALRGEAWEWLSREASPDSLLLGTPLELTLRVKAAPGEALRWPLPAKEQLAGWRLLEADSLVDSTSSAGRVLTRRLRLARYELGAAPLPVPGPWRDGAPVPADSLRLEILASLADTVGTPADILAPGRLSHGWRWWAARLAAGLALLAAAFWVWRRLRRRVRPEAVPVLPPDPWRDFLAELARVDALAQWQAGRVESHYADLSLALRGLLEDCLGLRCRERSTEELRLELRHSPLADGDLAELWRLLDENDWIKYARQWPGAEECLRASGRYRAWAEARKERLEAEFARRAAQLREARP